jgi:hypothetical protein
MKAHPKPGSPGMLGKFQEYSGNNYRKEIPQLIHFDV